MTATAEQNVPLVIRALEHLTDELESDYQRITRLADVHRVKAIYRSWHKLVEDAREKGYDFRRGWVYVGPQAAAKSMQTVHFSQARVELEKAVVANADQPEEAPQPEAIAAMIAELNESTEAMRDAYEVALRTEEPQEATAIYRQWAEQLPKAQAMGYDFRNEEWVFIGKRSKAASLRRAKQFPARPGRQQAAVLLPSTKRSSSKQSRKTWNIFSL